jgi:hypothetical protein
MAIRSSKLEKLTIQTYRDRARRQRIGCFKVMFNPPSFSLSHKAVFAAESPMDSSGPKHTYSHSAARSITLDFVFDGTGVAPGSSALGSVSRQIEDFLGKTIYMNGDIHEPNHLRLEWGDGPLQNFDCRMTSADVTYSLFDKSGAPLRATIKCTFADDVDDDKKQALDRKRSPDLTHARVVKAGDTLPLLCKEIYGASHYYLRVAQANHLDDFKNLVPGAMIRFPPLAK